MSNFYQNLLRPILFRLGTETAHDVGMRALKIGLGSKLAQDSAKKRFLVEGFGGLSRFGIDFPNPLGMAAGFDKNGMVAGQLSSLGFGFVEVGTVTYEPQTGNPKPRLFRLPKDRALINRLGFNNKGTRNVVERLRSLDADCVIGVNIGKNKSVPNDEAIENYLKSFDLAWDVADYIAVNVSSPNTPDLRDLQKADYLEELLGTLQRQNRFLGNAKAFKADQGSRTPKPLLVKIAPDLSEAEIEAIVDIALRLDISGIIATNTTIGRSGLTTEAANIKKTGAGGLSGMPLAGRSNEVIRRISVHSNNKLPIIGVGGIFNAEDAFEKIASGASLIQAYTGFIYHGFSFARDINKGLLRILDEKGFKSVDEAVGSAR